MKALRNWGLLRWKVSCWVGIPLRVFSHISGSEIVPQDDGVLNNDSSERQEFEEQHQAQSHEQRCRVIAALKKIIQRKRKVHHVLQSEAKLAEKAEETNRRAILISGALSKDFPSWKKELDATDWETGERVALSLDSNYREG